MKFIKIIALLFFCSCAPHSIKPGLKSIDKAVRHPSETSINPQEIHRNVHLVLDIDWTIVRPLGRDNLKDFLQTQRVISLSKDDHYLIHEGVKEILDFASKNTWLKITFFSGGKRARNYKLLSMIFDSNGASAKSYAHKVLSNEDLTTISQDETLRFSQRFKKDLKKAHPTLEDIIFVDDLKNFALDNGGLERTAWIGKTYHPWPENMNLNDYHSYWLERGKKPEYLAPNQDADFWTKRKLFVLLAVIEESGASPQMIHEKLMDFDLSKDGFEDSIMKALKESPSYQRFLNTLGCPLPLL